MWWGGVWWGSVGGWVGAWVALLRRTAQNVALCFPSPAPIFALFSLWGVFSWNFGGVFEGTLNVHVKSSRAVV